jgi:DNA-binding NarL/FixJ family response regulator
MILLASGDEVVRQRWADALASVERTVQVDDAARLKLFLSQRPPEIILLHLSLAGLERLAGVAELKRNYPDCRVLTFADVPSEQEGLAALRTGSEGYANTYMTPNMLVKAVEVVLLGEIWVGRRLMRQVLTLWRQATEPSPLELLTDREREVALLVSEGVSNRGLADELGITERTIKAHLTSIFRKTGIKDRTALAVRLSQQPILDQAGK